MDETTIELRRARAADLDELLAFYTAMIEATTGTDNDPLWVLGLHPAREDLATSIEAGQMLVAVDADRGMIAAAAVFDQQWPDGYNQAPWTLDVGDEAAWTFHLFAVHPAYQRHGIARRLVSAIEAAVREAGGRALRIDVLASNSASLLAYEHLGFHRVGAVHLTYEDPRVTDFVLFEKAVD